MAEPERGKDSPSFQDRLTAALTWISAVALVGSVLLTAWGIQVPERVITAWLLAPVLFVVGGAGLLHQSRLARKQLERDGTAPPPALLWTLVHNRVLHRTRELVDAHAMILVPQGCDGYARNIAESSGAAVGIDLHFHYMAGSSAHPQREQEGGAVEIGGALRTLEQLRRELDDCAALILLDDSNWNTYPATLAIVHDWAMRYSARPVIAIRLEGRGTLNYSWAHLHDVTRTRSAIFVHLLRQAISRGEQWNRQARANRWVALSLTGVALALGVIGSSGTLYYRSKYHRLNVVDAVTPNGQRELLLAASSIRTGGLDRDSLWQRLLVDHATNLKNTLEVAAPSSQPNGRSVVLFAVWKTNGDSTAIREVAATRRFSQTVTFTIGPKAEEIRGIVACAIASGTTVLWHGGLVDGKDSVETRRIRAWNAEGDAAGDFREGSLHLPNKRTCTYRQSNDELAGDDRRRWLWCAPIGADVGAGAVCISSNNEREILHEAWIRNVVQRIGTATGMFDWKRLTQDAAAVSNSGLAAGSPMSGPQP
jgi:hypothetical protein